MITKPKQFTFFLLGILLTNIIVLKAFSQPTYQYSITNKAWEEALGNHRAILHVPSQANSVELNFYWRRPDKDVTEHRFIIISATTGDTIKNIQRLIISNEVCNIRFGPVKKEEYYFYYLPYEVQPGHGFYSKGYYPKEKRPDNAWLNSVLKERKVYHAKVVKVQSRTAFDSFYPMEIIASKNETDHYSKDKALFYVFPEDRKFPIRMKKHLPQKWMGLPHGAVFSGVAKPNEYYAFQVGVWAPITDVKDLQYKISDLKTDNGKVISAKVVTCFNKEGVDPYGKYFTKTIDVAAGQVQALWFGIDVAEKQPPGIYKAELTISGASGYSRKIPLQITVSGDKIADKGDSEPWRHSRLRWLNSTLGISEEPTKPYTPVTVKDNDISILGRSVVIDTHSGLPSQIRSWQTDILLRPVSFIIQSASGTKNIPVQFSGIKSTKGSATVVITGEDKDLKIVAQARIEFDGWINYTYHISPKKDVDIKDIRLEITVKKEVAKYFMGAGLPGQTTPKSFKGKWDAPANTSAATVSLPTNKENSRLWPFDAFWIGNAHAGIHCELRGSTYSGPLLNLYRPAYPQSWYNGGKGGFTVSEENGNTVVSIYSGARQLKMNEKITFDFALLITPVKEINYKSQFLDRYYHNGGKPTPTEEDVKAGIRVINVHHANELNPVINYPFITVDKMKNFTKYWHDRNVKVKIYYTVRELTSAVTEIWALRSLEDEILRYGKGGGFPWTREHFDSDYTPQWYHHFKSLNETGFTADASVLTATGDSRWYNYYIEGLAWLVKNIDIDGLYLDDVAFDRRILQRMRRAMDDVKPGCFIDLHSNTGFSRGPATQYTEFFPYVDKLWLGESFIYDKMSPENWLIEASGIPFGLMSDMLHGGGNRWLGMQFGMTVRQPWMTEGVVVDPRPIWKIWDEFKIQDSKMIGFWELNNAVTTADNDVKITSYVRPGQLLVSIGNYSDEVKQVKLHYDWQQLEVNAQNAKLIAPEIKDFQPAAILNPQDTITLQPRRGWLFYLR